MAKAIIALAEWNLPSGFALSRLEGYLRVAPDAKQHKIVFVAFSIFLTV